MGIKNIINPLLPAVYFKIKFWIGVKMDQSESITYSFIIRIWREENSHPAWRGYITHVPSGKQRYLKKLDDTIAFIIPYMEEMGINVREECP